MTTTYTLTKTEDLVVGKKTEQKYTYESDKGGTVTFHAHPTRAWNWVIDAANDAGKKHVNKLITAFCAAGSSGRAFNEAIKVLTV